VLHLLSRIRDELERAVEFWFAHAQTPRNEEDISLGCTVEGVRWRENGPGTGVLCVLRGDERRAADGFQRLGDEPNINLVLHGRGRQNLERSHYINGVDAWKDEEVERLGLSSFRYRCNGEGHQAEKGQARSKNSQNTHLGIQKEKVLVRVGEEVSDELKDLTRTNASLYTVRFARESHLGSADFAACN
jgi:hypothetical protein